MRLGGLQRLAEGLEGGVEAVGRAPGEEGEEAGAEDLGGGADGVGDAAGHEEAEEEEAAVLATPVEAAVEAICHRGAPRV